MKDFTEDQMWEILDKATGKPGEFHGAVTFGRNLLAAAVELDNRLAPTNTPAYDKTTEAAHFDDHCIDRFAEAMKIKMAVCREQKGRDGWESAEPGELVRQLRVAIEKGDSIDVGNYCMMLFILGELIV